MRARLWLTLLLVAALAVAMVGPAVADGDDNPVFPLDTYPPTSRDNAVLKWNEAALECIRVTKPGPTVVARSLFIVHASIYDAWSGYDSRAVPTIRTGWSRRPSSARTLDNKSEAVSHAAHTALSDLFPPCRDDFDERLTSMSYEIGDTSTAAGDGRRAAQNVVNARRTDGANQGGAYADTTGYKPVNSSTTVTNPWRWQPLGVPLDAPTSQQNALTPQWSRVTPFDRNLSAQALQAPNPFELSNSERQAMIDELINHSATLDDRKKAIAEYWADGPASELPPGHWNLFAQWVSRRWRQSIDADARMFLGLNGAMLDSSIAAWTLKYRYDFARPVTTIRELRRGQMIRAWGGPGRGTQTIRGEDWLPYQSPTFPTPPFPAYTSGHSTFSAAGAAFMKDFGAIMGRDGDVFGASVTIRAGSSRFEANTPTRDVTLSWPSFTSASDQAGISRLYGGIHWSIDDLPARDMGKKVGESAFSLAKKLWEGG